MTLKGLSYLPFGLVLGLLASCGGPSDTSDQPDTEGTVALSVTGTSSFARAWSLEARQVFGIGPDYSHSVSLSFKSPLDTPPTEDRLLVTVDLSSDGYTGPGAYGCGINVVTPPDTMGPLCDIQLRHYTTPFTLPALWWMGVAPGELPDCHFTVNHDDATSFDGTLDCAALVFYDTADPASFTVDDPDRNAAVGVSATWSFPQRVVYQVQ